MKNQFIKLIKNFGEFNNWKDYPVTVIFHQ